MDWQSSDNAWFEHLRFRADCEYVLRVKGEEFVALVKATIEFSNEVT